MGKQVGFFANDKDYSELMKEAQAMGLVATTEITQIEDGPSVSTPTEFRLPEGNSFFYLFPESISPDELAFIPLREDPSLLKIDVREAPVIQINVSPIDGDKIGPPGRVYMGLKTSSEHYNTVSKLYNRLARRVKKWAKTAEFVFHVGPDTEQLVKEGKLRLMDFRLELKLE